MLIEWFLLYCCGLLDLCAHDGVCTTIMVNIQLAVAEEFLGVGRWRLAIGIFEARRCIALGGELASVGTDGVVRLVGGGNVIGVVCTFL